MARDLTNVTVFTFPLSCAEPFFNSQERVATLLDVAAGWRGTPWCANSEASGERGGVSCHNLPRAIYIECGALAPGFPKIVGTPHQANARNLIEPFLDSRPELRRLNPAESILPGDLLGLWLARDCCGNRIRHHHVNHLGVALTEGRFVHVLFHKRTDFDSYTVTPWLERRIAAWRPFGNPQSAIANPQ